ncbi:MAG: hypothetical protein ACI87E_004725 [Mariniblastus sp.]|jgi:hypothetical protein
MHEYSILSSDGVEMKFEGELIHEAESNITMDDQLERKFAIRVFAIHGGGFVPSLEYQTNHAFEKSVLWFEETENSEDVEKFFCAFDVCELMLSSAGLSREEKLEREAITKAVAREFETLMLKFLEGVKQEAERRGCLDRVKEPGKVSSIWGLFKIK